MSLLTRVIERFSQVTCKAAPLDGHPNAEPLSDRELEVAILLPSGPLDEQIVRQLGIQQSTVKMGED
jgi:DNA-binding NarL/FixJ family response regulator